MLECCLSAYAFVPDFGGLGMICINSNSAVTGRHLSC